MGCGCREREPGGSSARAALRRRSSAQTLRHACAVRVVESGPAPGPEQDQPEPVDGKKRSPYRQQAQRIIAAYEEAEADGRGVVTVDGRMIEHLHVANARRTIASSRAFSGVTDDADSSEELSRSGSGRDGGDDLVVGGVGVGAHLVVGAVLDRVRREDAGHRWRTRATSTAPRRPRRTRPTRRTRRARPAARDHRCRAHCTTCSCLNRRAPRSRRRTAWRSRGAGRPAPAW